MLQDTSKAGVAWHSFARTATPCIPLRLFCAAFVSLLPLPLPLLLLLLYACLPGQRQPMGSIIMCKSAALRQPSQLPSTAFFCHISPPSFNGSAVNIFFFRLRMLRQIPSGLHPVARLCIEVPTSEVWLPCERRTLVHLSDSHMSYKQPVRKDAQIDEQAA